MLSTVSYLVACETRDLKDFILGINTHHLGEKVNEHLQEVNIGKTRSDLNWNRVSDLQGEANLNEAVYNSILHADGFISDPLIILEYGHPAFDGGGRVVSPSGRDAFLKYAKKSVIPLRSKTRLFEVWNEWNVQGMGGTPATEGKGKAKDYVELLKRVYQELKSEDANLIILGGATAEIGLIDNYMENILKAGALNYMDGLSIHPYFWGSKGEGRIPENALNIRLDTLKKMLDKYTKGKVIPIYVTELGWPTFEKRGVTLEDQAKFMARSILFLANAPQVKGVWLYELRDGGTDPTEPEHHFGIIQNDGSPKPSFNVLKDLKHLIDDGKTIERVKNDSNGQVETMRLTNLDGTQSWICWAIHPEERWCIRFKRPASGAQDTIKVYALGESGICNSTKNVTLIEEGGVAKVTVRDMPIVICRLPLGTKLDFLTKISS